MSRSVGVVRLRSVQDISTYSAPDLRVYQHAMHSVQASLVRDTLHVRLDPASAPRRSRALAALCAELTDTATRYPGTDLTLAYSVKQHP